MCLLLIAYTFLILDGIMIAIQRLMKIALAYCNGRISPVFDVSENLLVFDDEKIEERKSIKIVGRGAFERAAELSRLKIELLICGAVSDLQETALKNVGIEVIGFICGELEQVFNAFAQGNLANERFLMPGCCGRRHGGRHGHCGRRGEKFRR
jgi:predicted Fe-Mo cluster-binding NifX family protein